MLNMMIVRVNTPILILYWPGKQAAVLDALSHSYIFRDSMDKSADSQPLIVS